MLYRMKISRRRPGPLASSFIPHGRGLKSYQVRARGVANLNVSHTHNSEKQLNRLRTYTGTGNECGVNLAQNHARYEHFRQLQSCWFAGPACMRHQLLPTKRQASRQMFLQRGSTNTLVSGFRTGHCRCDVVFNTQSASLWDGFFRTTTVTPVASHSKQC